MYKTSKNKTMTKKLFFAAMCIGLSLYLQSCKDIVSTNLSKSSVTILAPANNYVSKDYTILFWWEEVEGAEHYNVQIVKPSFTSGQQLVADTTLSGNKYAITLTPGKYQWRVKALNNSSSTDYLTYNLSIDSSQNLSSQSVIIISPTNNIYVNKLTQSFSWLQVQNATEYLFRITTTSDLSIGNPQTVSSTSIAFTFPLEGTYKWKVAALNSQSTSPYAERTITVDTTKPAAPSITFLPVNDTTRLKPVPLSWNSPETNATYHLIIASDSTFNTIVKDTSLAAFVYNFTFAIQNQNYYWKVRATDAATNNGSYTTPKRFKVVP